MRIILVDYQSLIQISVYQKEGEALYRSFALPCRLKPYVKIETYFIKNECLGIVRNADLGLF